MSPNGINDQNAHMNEDTTYPARDGDHHAPGIPPAARAIVIIAAVLILLGVGYRLVGHFADERNLKQVTIDNSVPTVSVIKPTASGSTNELELPGNTQAFVDTPIYARTSGYLKSWYFDIGAHVTKGQLMATIETPELDEQLQVARADLKSAQADLNLANTTSERYQNLLKSDSVSKQETDVAVSGASAKRAAVEAAEANVRRLAQLQSFEKIYAPYTGVVTVRNTDIGDLIDSGSSASSNTAKELFRVASTNQLRVFVAIPEFYAPDIHNGDKATLTLDEYPGQGFVGTVTRNSGTIDSGTRTLNVEVDIDNKSGKLLPGAYVFVHFKIPTQAQLLSIPANAVLFRSQGMQVAVVKDGKVHLQHVTIGKDNGKTLEIASGVQASDTIIVDPSDSIAEGAPVQIKTSAAGAK
ncbi:efflux RND transporter periplasmic adaptor subunit [Granulicella paludicola]|uniref:efflux RND transporter periplasmic adaptor subunit n=1 Tax=Granulicella paludicola TaxID=474951 RepID=UPI0021DFC8DF|nr:efflux RND transporter periplasmic adaptor subunit [Granulicella paludicola]